MIIPIFFFLSPEQQESYRRILHLFRIEFII